MATIKLYDERDPRIIGREVFKALLEGTNEDEILVDRDGLRSLSGSVRQMRRMFSE